MPVYPNPKTDAQLRKAFSDLVNVSGTTTVTITPPATLGADGELIQSDGTGNGVEGSGILASTVVTAAAPFAVDNRILRADGAVRGAQFSTALANDDGSITIAIPAATAEPPKRALIVLANDGTETFAIQVSDALVGNVFMGNNQGASVTTASGCVCIGAFAGTGLTSGDENVCLGESAGQLISTGIRNLAIGRRALRAVTTGSDNVALGSESMQLSSIGAGANMGIGFRALRNVASNSNTAIGPNAGDALTSGGNCTFIGAQSGSIAQGQVATAAGAIGIGFGVIAISNQAVLGPSTITSTILRGAITGYSSFDTAFVFNEPGADIDARFEGDSLTHMLFLDASAATENIALVTTAIPNWQTMDRGLFVGDVSTAPTGNPSAGVFVYSESGELKCRNTAGDVIVLVNKHYATYAAGTSYTLTTTPAAATFGTTNPVVVLTEAGTYKISGWAVLEDVGVVDGTPRVATLTLRRTNNTAADLANGSALITYEADAIGHTETHAAVYWEAADYVTTNTNDSLTIFASIAALPSSGTREISQAFIKAHRIA